jgi:predicted phosphate transport protein (TIGR00153 family)
MSLQSIVRWLVPREDRFYDFLEGQANAAHEGAKALARFKDGKPVAEVRDAVEKLEHEGDRLSHAMEDALAKTFVTPIDREDLHSLSSQLDDILDLANGAIRAASLFGVERPSPAMAKLMEVLVACTSTVKDAVPLLRKHRYAEIGQARRLIEKLEKDADAIYRDAVRALFQDDAVGPKELLREKQVLEDLENAIDHCERVGDTLANLAVKHG